ncbi:glycosyltransferase family 2 protein [Marmoricola sp. Leaf446]|uniref:glycosyltransferase family 2 protein n=1 Tax=Marmoricola sp. Leaf446 TaxID=1736379 RepID=UPI001F3FF8A3|nr:glycosyltransferase family 2 protein [Marmoricola sp. Leaf446]
MVVPAYNEASTIVGVVQALLAHFDRVVCVDDGSTDDTASLARSAGATVVRHVLNRGQGAALQTGFDLVLRAGGARYVVTFDADGQHLPLDAVRMVEHARTHDLDVVLASRFLGECRSIPASRLALLRAAVWFSRRSTGLPLTDTHNGLRVLSLTALRAIRLEFPGMAYASELEACVARSGLPWAEVATTVLYTDYSRAKGQSNANAVNIVFDLVLQRLRVAL